MRLEFYMGFQKGIVGCLLAWEKWKPKKHILPLAQGPEYLTMTGIL